ncbi:MAG TPA: response regulator [Actinomycetes bacterium]|jgi:DNA-binding NarL/FixJ family response regulator|nr:response regulator [Actinomycetes bacterium]
MVRVLLVDDDPDYRLLVRLALDAEPEFEVVAEARNGREAALAAPRARPDLILLDCSMPGADAFEALPELRRVCPQGRVILLSGYGTADLELASRLAGALGFLPKDTPPSRLASELATVAGLVGAVETVVCQASTSLSGEPRSAREARRFVTTALEEWQLGSLLETVTLLTSELVTNAIVHTGSEVDVVVRLTGEAARVEVTDRSDVPPAPRAAPDSDGSGRGLALVEALARRWGTRRMVGGGKTVWFEVPRGRASETSA